jgi:RNA polymerase sigma-70 factor (ECF subfamily)
MRRQGPSAAEGFLLAMAPRLRGYVRVLLANAADAEDVLQETFLGYLKGGPGAGTPNAERWLFRVARNRALNLLRDEARRRRREAARPEPAPRPAPDPAGQAELSEAARRIEACLDQVPLEAREMLYLKVAEDLSLSEIAERTGTPKSTVALRLQEGLILLNRLFRGGGPP